MDKGAAGEFGVREERREAACGQGCWYCHAGEDGPRGPRRGTIGGMLCWAGKQSPEPSRVPEVAGKLRGGQKSGLRICCPGGHWLLWGAHFSGVRGIVDWKVPKKWGNCNSSLGILL